MRRHSGKLLTPRPSPFGAWAAYVRHEVARLGGVKVAVVPPEYDPPAKVRPRRKPKHTRKTRARVKR